MAELRATPMSNPILGLLADRLKKAQQFGAKPFGYENPPVEMLMNLLGVPAVQQTMERMAYGEPLTTGSGMTTKPRPEAIEAAMTLLPASVGLAKATKGLPVGASIKPINLEKGIYKADLTMEEMLKVRDIPTVERVQKSVELVGEKQFEKMVEAQFKKYKPSSPEQEAMLVESVTLQILGKAERSPFPRQEALDTAQRNAALPVEEGGLGLPKDNTPMDRAKAMGFDTDTLHGSPNPNIESFDPMMAGRNTGNAFDNNIFATSSPESAGGYALNWKHYRNTIKTSPEFRAINREENALLSQIGDLREAGDTKGIAELRARLDELTDQKTRIYNDFMAGKLGSEGSTIYPLMVRSEDFLPYEAESANWMRANRPAIDAAQQAGYSGALIKNVKDNAGANLGTIADVVASQDPSRFRSRFAAFDPMRKNEADILAGVLPLGLLADEEQRKKLYELMPSLLGQ